MTDQSTPLVSIVIPVYNQKMTYFQEALESALSQTYPNIEVVVSDNHCTNEIPGYLAAIVNPKLVVRKPETFLPMTLNFQFAADQASGDFIVFLCSDDFLHSDFVSSMIPYLVNKPNTAFGYSELACVEHYDLSAVRFYYHRKQTGHRASLESLQELLKARPLLGFFPSFIMRRDAYKQVRYLLSGTIHFAFDIAIVFRLHELGDGFYLDKPLGKVRYWTALDGKTSDDRFLEFIEDTGHVCALLDESEVLRPNRTLVDEWRQFQARRWLMVALFWSVRGNVSVSKSKRGVEQIRQQIANRPLFSALIVGILSKPQSYVLRPLLKAGFQVMWYIQTLIKIPM